jgi:hypothetical protein
VDVTAAVTTAPGQTPLTKTKMTAIQIATKVKPNWAA